VRSSTVTSASGSAERIIETTCSDVTIAGDGKSLNQSSVLSY
jgi:hypothetical protein